jgi:hypothetical protein
MVQHHRVKPAWSKKISVLEMCEVKKKKKLIAATNSMQKVNHFKYLLAEIPQLN